MELTELVAWSRAAYPHGGEGVGGRSLDGLSDLQSSALRVASAYEMFQDGHSPEETLLRLGTGLNGLAKHLRVNGTHDAAMHTFSMAFLGLTSLHDRDGQPERFIKAINFAHANFKSLGGEVEAVCDIPAEPFIDLGEVLQASLVDPADTNGGVVAAEPLMTLHEIASCVELLEGAMESWPANGVTRPTAEIVPELERFFEKQLGQSDLLVRDLSVVFGQDREFLLSEMIPSDLPMDSECLSRAAQELRTLAFRRSHDPSEPRRRWILAALMNYALLSMPAGLSTNAAQVQFDLMGYLSSIQIARRYTDSDRDLLLDCAEAEVRLACNMPPIFLNRFQQVRDWVLAAVGTYLILSGPNPSSPSDNYYDERVHSDDAPHTRGLGRARRQEWPEMLLDEWRLKSDTADGACFALASLGGWDLARSCWIVDRIYDESKDSQSDLSRDAWHERLEDLLARVDRVRIVTNPWRSTEPTASRGTIITSDEAGRFVVPDGLLRAAIAQGLKLGEAVSVQGHLFEGRRIPTYLLSRKFGPYAILKIDHRDKVLRELRNFEEYAKRQLHPSHRPSECVAYETDMYLGEDGAPLRAIATSYVFDEDDSPLTLGTWLRSADPDLAAQTLEQFLTRTLRPWLAHIRRNRVDLRTEYPVLRPAPAPGKQQQSHWAETEIERLESPSVGTALEVSLSRDDRDPNWFDELEGAHAVLGAGVARTSIVNPLWLCLEFADIGSGSLDSALDELEVRDLDTLLCRAHGDLHLDNVLCTVALEGASPRTVLIDFESTHEGHVCKDIARVEASILCQIFKLESDTEAATVTSWFTSSVQPGAVFECAVVRDAGSEVESITLTVARLRWIAHQCGQGLWPVRSWEYLVALFSALLPMARWTSLTSNQRRRALLFATVVGSALYAECEQHTGTAV